MENFCSLGLSEPMMQSLERLKFTAPTPIQAETIPIALAGKDVMGSAQTGTGKTAAFGIPLVEKLLANPKSSALIIAPTRELAAQIMKAIQDLLSKDWVRQTVLLIGGESIVKQLRQLKSRPRIVVGTPGRINDHINRKTLSLKSTDFLVLDETDRMLDMGFTIQIDEIVQHLPKERQTLMFSATMPKNIVTAAKKYLVDPVRIAIDAGITAAPKIKQDVVFLSEKEKYQKLLEELNEREGSIIVFVKTKINADRLATKLRKEDHYADAIHGDLRHSKRERVIRAFRSRKYRILVATDIAARGLDIPHIEHVVNYDLPQCPEDYIHRIGRTARAGNTGEALCFVSPADKGKWHAINCMMNPDAEECKRPPRGNGSGNRNRNGNGNGNGSRPKRDGEKSRFGKKRFSPQGQNRRKKAFVKG